MRRRLGRGCFTSWTLAIGLTAICNHALPSEPAHQDGKTAQTTSAEVGIASYYAAKYHGKPTASGELFDMHAMTAAHPTLSFGTKLKVTHLGNDRSVTVRINDRGPFVKGRVIDLSPAAADELRMTESGLAKVRLEIVE